VCGGRAQCCEIIIHAYKFIHLKNNGMETVTAILSTNSLFGILIEKPKE
jgi:hypothetical protein